MRECKKVIFVILAFLPIVVLLFNCFGNMFSNAGFDFVPLGSVSLSDGVLTIEPDTIADYVLTPLGLNSAASVGGLTSTILDCLVWFSVNSGIPINFTTIMVIYYNLYLFVLWLFDLLFDMLLFVPRKVQEVLR